MTPEKSHPNLQYRLGCQAPLGRGDGVARKKRPSAFVANRACHPSLPPQIAIPNALQQVSQLYRRWFILKGHYSEHPYKQRFPEFP
ncbi:MAG: hypothetical protein WCS19_08505 [Candidatus Cloacimonadaceae bacterium]